MEKGEDVDPAQLGKWWLEGVEVVNGRETDCTWSGKRRRVLQVEKRLLDKKLSTEAHNEQAKQRICRMQ